MLLTTLNSQQNYISAIHDFKRLRDAARWQQAITFITRRPSALMSYEDVCSQLGAISFGVPMLREIPLTAIRGSVGRSEEFTADFLPKKDSSLERWVGVKAAVMSMTGLKPIEVYEIEGVYFVEDGNHRVSVARQLGVETISAYVTRVETLQPFAAYKRSHK